MSKTSKTQFAILGLLSIGPMSGYGMRQVMQHSTSYFWSESDGQLYPTLSKLAAKGLIECKPKADKNTRDKKEYSITKSGLTELKKWLAQKPETQTVRNELMLKLFFSANVNPETSIEHFQTYRYELKSLLNQLASTEQQLSHEEKQSSHYPYWKLTIEYGLLISQAKMQWCDLVIDTLQKITSRELS